jgi:phosphoserine phosphatase RsbU/P
MVHYVDSAAVSVGGPGALLGVFDTPTLHDQQRPMEPGVHLMLYTDGVSEGRRGVEFYGEQRLHAAISSGGSARDVSERILQDVLDFQGETPADDIAIIVVHVPKDSAQN